MDPTPDDLEPVEPATHEPVQPESTTAQPPDSTSATTSAITPATTSAAAAKIAAAKAAAAAKRANGAERTTPGNAETPAGQAKPTARQAKPTAGQAKPTAGQAKPAAAPAKAKPSQSQRLSRFIAIGALMVAVAVAGYLLLGPDGQIARSTHERPADVATNVPAAPPAAASTGVADAAALPARAGSGNPAPIQAATDLDTMRTEMQTITAKVNAILSTVQVTATISAAPPASLNMTPSLPAGEE